MKSCAAIFLIGFRLLAADAQLTGVITDPSGAAITGAAVAAMNQDTGIRRTARSDSQGSYGIGSLPPGSYKITARREGFQTVARVNVPLESGAGARVDFTMPLGSVREVVTVEGGPERMNTQDGTVANLFGREVLDGLPLNGRGILGVLDLAPGVLATPATRGEAGQFSVNGQRSNTNYFTIDGVSANTGIGGGGLPGQFPGATLPGMTAFGGTQSLASLQAVEEVRVQTSSFAPEFGRMPGAQVALTSRSGSNELHGSVSHLFRNEKLDANDWFANRGGLPRAPMRLNHWTAAVGGPLRRDRTFFFSSYEGLRLRQPYLFRAATPSLEARRSAPEHLRALLGIFPEPNGLALGRGLAELLLRSSRPSRLDAGSLRVDHTVSARLTLFARFNQAPSSTEIGVWQSEHSSIGARNVTAGATALLGPALTNDLRVSAWAWSAESQWRTDPVRSAALRSLFPALDRDGTAVYGLAIGGVGELVSGGGGRNRQGQWSIVNTLAWQHGAHSLRLGADYQRLTPEREGAAFSFTGKYDSLSDLLAEAPLLTAFTEAQQASSLIESLSVFFQDTWRPTPRLAVTFGTRWELTPAPAVRGGGLRATRDPMVLPLLPPVEGLSSLIASQPGGALWPTRYTQLAPRLGLAWRATPRSVLRAGWGVFYDLAFGVMTDPINGFPFNRWQFSELGGPSVVQSGTAGPFAGRNLRLPYSVQWNLTYERQLGAPNVVSAGYVGSAGRRLLRREGIVDPHNRLTRLTFPTNHGASDYHALQLHYRRAMARSLQGVFSYTWSHAIDNASMDSAVALVAPGLAARHDRASSSFDVRHAFSAAVDYEPPWPGGWRLTGIFRARTGFPIDVLTSANPLGLGFDNVTRPDLRPGVPLWISDPGAPGRRQLNRAAFAAPSGLQGTLGRNAIAGFGMSQLDASLQRRFPLRERSALEVRLEAYNILNRPAFGDPVRFLDTPLFGHPASLLNLMLGRGSPSSGLTPAFHLGGPRSLQLQLRFQF